MNLRAFTIIFALSVCMGVGIATPVETSACSGRLCSGTPPTCNLRISLGAIDAVTPEMGGTRVRIQVRLPVVYIMSVRFNVLAFAMYHYV